MIFQGLSVARDCLRPETAPLTIHFKCIIKREVIMFLSFRKNKETKCISVQISKKFDEMGKSLGKIHDVCSFKDIRQSRFHAKLFKCK